MYAIRFDYGDGVMLYAGMHKGAFSWAPTLATANLYDDASTAGRVLKNAYGGLAKIGQVVEVSQPDAAAEG